VDRSRTGLTLRSLCAGDADALAAMLRTERPEYLQHFTPFPFEVGHIRGMLETARDDRYWAIDVEGKIAGFFMLRGLDAGYAIPSYGVAIAERFARRGLLKLTLSVVAAWCRLNAIERLMLKVHADNVVARRAYERFGFRFDRPEDGTGHLIYYFDVPVPTA
jgi:RimJ/RimL family protein N-acetyltransferase